MKAEELLSILVSIENDLSIQYDKFCMGDIKKETYQKRSEKIIKKQIDLINNFKKDLLITFVNEIMSNPKYHKLKNNKIVNEYLK